METFYDAIKVGAQMKVVNRKTAGNKTGRQKVPFIFFWGIFFVFFAGIFVAFLLYGQKTLPPVYEEIYTSSPDIKKEIKIIDYALYDALYKNRIKTKNVVFYDVKTIHKNNLVWNFTNVLIKCPDYRSAKRLKRFIYALSERDKKITVRMLSSSDSMATFVVSVQGHRTHKISIKLKGYFLPARKRKPKIAIIIDDLGYNKDIAHSFIESGVPLTLSVFPLAPFTHAICLDAAAHGCDVMLHLPMEPKGYPRVRPGPGALFLHMTDKKMRQILRRDLKAVPYACGVNNHMGSAFTECKNKMLVVLKELKRHGLFYVDSRTSALTVGFKLAEQLGIPSAQRNVFLDNDTDEKSIRIQMERLFSMARHKGMAIGIGHPYVETLKVIRRYAPHLKENFDVVPVAELVH